MTAREYRRQVVSRTSTATCTVCPQAWEGTAAMAAGTSHAVGSGHVVRAQYAATYDYVPARCAVLSTVPCPSCGQPAYDFVIGHVHADGSANDPCWAALLRTSWALVEGGEGR